MATRLRKRPLIDAVRDARRQLEAVNLDIGRHVTSCYRCSQAGGHTAKLCDTGWELAKVQNRARNALTRAEDAASSRPVQGTLW